MKTVREFITEHPGMALEMMTPGGYVSLAPEKARALLQGESAEGHPGDPEHAMKIDADVLLAQTVHSEKFHAGAWRLLTDYAQKEAGEDKRPERSEIMERLREKLDKNLQEYRACLLSRTRLDLIEMSREIDAAFTVYDELCAGGYSAEHLEYLLRFDDPLEVVRDYWIQHNDLPVDEEMSRVLWHIMDCGDAEQSYRPDEGYKAPGTDRGVTMC